MPNKATIVEEMTAAARGVVALILGDRRAAGYFDFSQRGLAGSFIAFLVVTAINAGLPIFFGAGGPPGSIFKSVAMIAVLFSLQVGFSAIVLRQLKRMDGLVPYLVADNWATFFVTIVSTLLVIFGLSGDVSLIFVGLLVIVIEINIARLIVTLSPLQIAMFLIAQLVGVAIGLIVIGVLFPLSPDEVRALGTSMQPA